ncbi:MerR family transcriptional regulator [Cohnella rhizosphaerae]|uniref:HTH merR-type domain-containing protein n=1 Tax=Cohnella rhizosphaerae TaxID=1457232 RepID=A0A9X4QWW5_9BACL|nr:hypothetical protein [Cohnella rhizosphaerae]MDG0813973.1 hypothetical protein [Cohnella rhizosphaerae]
MVKTVQALRSTGLPLAEIKEYVALYKRGSSTLEPRKKTAETPKKAKCRTR